MQNNQIFEAQGCIGNIKLPKDKDKNNKSIYKKIEVYGNAICELVVGPKCNYDDLDLSYLTIEIPQNIKIDGSTFVGTKLFGTKINQLENLHIDIIDKYITSVEEEYKEKNRKIKDY